VRYVAIATFVDPFDGGEIIKGRTYVSREADVFKKFPERFEVARSSRLDRAAITRVGGSIELVDRPRRRPPKRPAHTSSVRPSWQLTEREPWRLR
jgi:hypothetical protein